MKKTTIIFVAVMLLLAGACKKGSPVEDQSLAFLNLHLIDLPGSPTLDVYMNDIKLKDSLFAFIVPLFPRQLLLAGKPTRISFRKKGTDAIVLDTSLVMESGQNMLMRIAFSEELGLKSILKPSGFGADSLSFLLYNNLPAAIQADSLQINAELYRRHPVTGAEEEIAVFENFNRLKLHPQKVALAFTENGVQISYFIKFKNAKTGVYLTDTFVDILEVLEYQAGKEYILKIYAEEVDLGGALWYFWTAVPIEI